jgi:hypothetical protein
MTALHDNFEKKTFFNVLCSMYKNQFFAKVTIALKSKYYYMITLHDNFVEIKTFFNVLCSMYKTKLFKNLKYFKWKYQTDTF